MHYVVSRVPGTRDLELEPKLELNIIIPKCTIWLMAQIGSDWGPSRFSVEAHKIFSSDCEPDPAKPIIFHPG